MCVKKKISKRKFNKNSCVRCAQAKNLKDKKGGNQGFPC